MDIVKYLHNLGRELQGLNADQDAREEVLAYISERLAQALEMVNHELEAENGND